MSVNLTMRGEYFNVSNFNSKLSFLTTETLMEFKSILKKPSAERTQADIDTLSLMSKSVEQFRNIDDMRRDAIFRVASVLEVNSNYTLYSKRDECTDFFILLSGSIDIFIEQDSHPLSSALRQKPSKFNKKGIVQSTRIGEYNVMDAFGNTSLIDGCCSSFQSANNKTVTTRTACVVLVVDASDLEEEVSSSNEKLLTLKKEFLQSVPVFESLVLPPELLNTLSYKLYPAQVCILTQGKTTPCVYVISSGTCRVIKAFDNNRLHIDCGKLSRGDVFGNSTASSSSSSKKANSLGALTSPLEYSVVTDTHVKVLMIPIKVFMALEMRTATGDIVPVQNIPQIRPPESVAVVKSQLKQTESWNAYKASVVANETKRNSPTSPRVRRMKLKEIVSFI